RPPSAAGAPSTSRRRSSACSSKRPKRRGNAAAGVLIGGGSWHGGIGGGSGAAWERPRSASGIEPLQKIGDPFQTDFKTPAMATPTVTAVPTHHRSAPLPRKP